MTGIMPNPMKTQPMFNLAEIQDRATRSSLWMEEKMSEIVHALESAATVKAAAAITTEKSMEVTAAATAETDFTLAETIIFDRTQTTSDGMHAGADKNMNIEGTDIH